MTRRALAFFAALAASALPACGGAPPARPAEPAYAEPHWQDVFESTPELLVVVRARAARQDRVYGPLVRRAFELAREQSAVVASSRVLDAMGDADEVVVGLRPESADRTGELVLVARGVPADIDPGKLVDAEGRALWTAGPPGAVRELVREHDEPGHPVAASLFELPGRTWVIAQGEARTRAREAFAHPFDRPVVALDPQAVAIVRIDGPSLVRRVRPLQDLGGLAAVGHHLQAVTFVLPPGAERTVRATFTYAGDDDAALAEVAARETVAALSRAGNKAPWVAWLASATVDRAPKTVVLKAPVPPQLVEALLHAASAPLDGDLTPKN